MHLGFCSTIFSSADFRENSSYIKGWQIILLFDFYVKVMFENKKTLSLHLHTVIIEKDLRKKGVKLTKKCKKL